MRAQEKQEAEKLAELLAQAEDHPVMKAIKAEKAAGVLRTRREVAEKIEGLKQKDEAVIPELEAELAAREADLAQYDEERKVILEKVVTAREVLAQERQRIDYEIRQAEIVLLSNYDERLDEAILWFRDRHEALLRKSPDKQTRRGKINVFSMTKELTTFSNVAAIESGLTYCLSAIRELESMRLTPVLDVARIDELKRNLPDVTTMEEITLDRPLPGINIDPRTGLKSDSEMDWTIGKLNQKFKKLMARK